MLFTTTHLVASILSLVASTAETSTLGATQLTPLNDNDDIDLLKEHRNLVGLDGKWIQMTPELNISSSSLSLSLDGKHMAVATSIGVQVYELDRLSWKQLGSNIDFGSTVSMSEDGMRVAIGDRFYGEEVGQVRVYEYRLSTWEQLGDPIDAYEEADQSNEYGQFGLFLSMSDDGNSLAISGDEYYAPGPQVFKWEGLIWNRLTTDNVYKDYGGFRGIPVSISGDGQRLAVSHEENDLAVVYEWDGSSFEQIGQYLGGIPESQFGYSVTLDQTGNHLAVGANQAAGYVHVYQWSSTLSEWEQMGADLAGDAPNDGFGSSLSMSSNGQRLAVGSPQPSNSFWRLEDGSFQCGDRDENGNRVTSTRAGYARVFEWDDESKEWVKVGTTIHGEAPCDSLGHRHGLSISGDGKRLVTRGRGIRRVGPDGELGSPYVRTFQYDQNPENDVFPPDFSDEVTCVYQSCLDSLLQEFNALPKDLGDRTLDRYTSNSRSKIKRSRRNIAGDGNIIKSLDKVVQSMKWTELVGSSGSNSGNDVAVKFSRDIGNSGSSCAVDFVENFINAFLGSGILDDDFLKDKPTRLLKWAKKRRSEGKWKKSAKNSFWSLHRMMKELGKKRIPRCDG